MALISYKAYPTLEIGSHASSHVGLITSKEGVMKAVKAFVIRQKGDESTASYHAIFNDYSSGKGYLTRDDIQRFLSDAKACAVIGCKATADQTVSAMDKNGDGNVDWEEFRQSAGLAPEEPTAPAPEEPAPVTPTPITPVMFTRATPYELPSAAMFAVERPAKSTATVPTAESKPSYLLYGIIGLPIAYFLYKKVR